MKRLLLLLPFFISALNLGGCAKVKLTTNGLWEMPVGSWSQNAVIDTVKQFAPALGGEVGVLFGEDITAFELVTKYIPLNTVEWDRYNQSIGNNLHSHGQLWALLAGFGIEFPVKNFTPIFSLRAGYMAPTGSETFVAAPAETLRYPLTFLRKAPGMNVSLGLSLPRFKFVRLSPKVEYTLVPAIRFPGGPRPGWMSLFEAGLGIDFLITQPKPAVEVEKELAFRIKEKEQKMSESYFSQGVSYYNLTRYLEAINSLDLALIWNPDNSTADEWVGRAKRAKEDSDIKTYLDLAEKSYGAGQYVEALVASEKVLAIDGQNPKGLEMKHRAELAFAGQLEKQQSEDVKKHLDAGKTFYLKGNYNEAIAEWTELLKLSPTDEEAKRYLSWAQAKRQETIDQSLAQVDSYIKEEQWEKAIKECNKVLAQDPNNLQAAELNRIVQRRLNEKKESLLSRAVTAYKAGDIIDAEEKFRAVLRIDPRNSDAKGYLDKIKGKKIKRKKDDASDLYLKGIDAYTKNDFELAIFFWTKVLEIDPNYSNARKNLERAKAKLEITAEGS